MNLQIFKPLVVGVLLLAVPPSLSAQVPNLVSHQGRVAVNGVNFDGTGMFKFALVNADGSVSFWSNDKTSVGGSEPTAAVSVLVTKGLYSVLLGDKLLSDMSELPAEVFSNPDVRLRVWFSDGVLGFQQLTPDQRLGTDGYLPDGVVTTAKLADGVVTTAKLATGAVGAANIAAGAIWRLDAPDGSPTGAVRVNADGLVGIGIASPTAQLHVLGDLKVEQAGSVELGANRFWAGSGNAATGNGSVALGTNATSAHDRSFVWSDSTAFSSTAANQFLVRATGGVGINTNNPGGAALAVNGNITSTGTISGNGSGLTGINAANLTGAVPGTSLTSVPATSLTGTIDQARLPVSVALRNASNTFTANQFVNGSLQATGTAVLGAVGIGTNSPAQPLQVGNSAVEDSLGMMRFASRGSGITANWARYWDVGVPRSSTDITGRNLSFIVDDPQHGNNPELMIDWTNGFVGMGVPYPEADLHLYSESNPIILRIQSGGTPGRGRVEFWSNPTDDPNEWRPCYIESSDNGGFTGIMRFVVNGTGAANKAASLETMRLVNGRVGIRTATPAYELDVNGNAYVSGQLSSGTAMFAPAFNISSDRNVKENFESIDPREMLDKVVELPLSRWNFKQDPDVEHIGPMAQDFYAAFATGVDDKHIATVDADGVALAAIQGLNAKLASELERKAAELAELRQAVRMESAALKAENAAMVERLAALEAMMRKMQASGVGAGGAP